MENKKKGESKDAVSLFESALNDARANKTGVAVIDLDNSRETVQIGDLAGVRYCLTLENGEILRTNIRAILDNRKITLSDYYIESIALSDIKVLAGERDAFPGLHSGVIGMKKGETNKIFISPEEGYGQRSDARVKKFSSVRTLPKKTSISIEKFIEIFKSGPAKGNTVHLVPYFNHRIAEINEKEIILEAEIKDAFSLKSEIGDTRIFPEENNIVVILEPRLGADFSDGKDKGKIASIDENSFTVDFNHPLAGKNLLLELTVDSIIKASTVRNWEIPWLENYDEGLEIARKSGKPVALVLYEDGCPWCERLFNITMKDPRIENFKNEFIWIKANENKYPEIMDIYDADSYPSILLLDSKGQIVEKMRGYKYAFDLRDNLRRVLQKMEASAFIFEDHAKYQLTIN